MYRMIFDTLHVYFRNIFQTIAFRTILPARKKRKLCFKLLLYLRYVGTRIKTQKFSFKRIIKRRQLKTAKTWTKKNVLRKGPYR